MENPTTCDDRSPLSPEIRYRSNSKSTGGEWSMVNGVWFRLLTVWLSSRLDFREGTAFYPVWAWVLRDQTDGSETGGLTAGGSAESAGLRNTNWRPVHRLLCPRSEARARWWPVVNVCRHGIQPGSGCTGCRTHGRLVDSEH